MQLHGALRHLELSAPLLLHVSTPALQALCSGGAGEGQRFRGAGAGSAAREAALFEGAYTSGSAEQEDRPALGALSITGDSRGVARAAEAFGRHYLMLRPSTTRSRVTLACSGAGSAVGTLAHCAHMLEDFTEAELAGLLAVGAGEAEAQAFGRECAAGAVYQEVQVHGRVRLAEDVEAVVVVGEEAAQGSAARSAAERFAARYGCSLVVVGERIVEQ